MLKLLIPSKLVDRLHTKQVPPLFTVLVLSLIFVIQSLFGRPGLVGHLAAPESRPLAFLHLAIIIISLWIAYYANGGSKGEDFLNRYITLGSVIFLWIYVIGIVLYIFIYIAFRMVVGGLAVDLFRHYRPAQIIFSGLTSLFFILYLRNLLRKLSAVPTT